MSFLHIICTEELRADFIGGELAAKADKLSLSPGTVDGRTDITCEHNAVTNWTRKVIKDDQNNEG